MTPDEIIFALAELDPIIESGSGDGERFCFFCGDAWPDKPEHAHDCLWVHAKLLAEHPK